MKASEYPSLALAYLGDAIYEKAVRLFLLQKGMVKVNELQKEAVTYVSAKAQCNYFNQLMDQNFFTETELAIFTRARNHKTGSHPKHTDILTYKYATGLEALLGYLYLNGEETRIDEIMSFILGGDYVYLREK